MALEQPRLSPLKETLESEWPQISYAITLRALST